jgi:hypothetical protein
LQDNTTHNVSMRRYFASNLSGREPPQTVACDCFDAFERLYHNGVL